MTATGLMTESRKLDRFIERLNKNFGKVLKVVCNKSMFVEGKIMYCGETQQNKQHERNKIGFADSCDL